MLPVFFQPVVVPAAALVMSHGDLHAVVFTAAVSDRAGVHRDAGSAVRMEAEARFTLAVIRPWSVDTALLAAAVMDLALVDILTAFSILLQRLTFWTLAVETSDCIAALHLTSSVCGLALINIVLTARSLKSRGTETSLGRSFYTISSIETNAGIAGGVTATCLPVQLGPPRTAFIHSLILPTVHLAVGRVVRRSPLISNAPHLPSTSLFPDLDHSAVGFHHRLFVGHYGHLPLWAHVGHVRLQCPPIGGGTSLPGIQEQQQRHPSPDPDR